MDSLDHFKRYLQTVNWHRLQSLQFITVSGPSPVHARFITVALQNFVHREIAGRLNTPSRTEF